MQALKQMGGGFLLAALSLLVVIGGITLALTEGAAPAPVTDTPTEPPPTIAMDTATPTLDEMSLLLTLWPSEMPTQLVTEFATLTFTLPPTLAQLSATPGNPTITPVPCGAPSGWVLQYTVQSGDTLTRISILYRTTVLQLQQANCLGTSSNIYAGQRLWVPNVPTSTPPATPIEIIFASDTPTPTNTPTATATPTATNTDVPTPTDTSVPPTPTATPSPTPSATSTGP